MKSLEEESSLPILDDENIENSQVKCENKFVATMSHLWSKKAVRKLAVVLAIIAVILFVVEIVGFIQFTSVRKNIEAAITGTWEYDFYASLAGEHCHSIYTFKNGNVVHDWINDESSYKSSCSTGTYKITRKNIKLKLNEGSNVPIEYEFENGVLRLWYLYDELIKQ